MRIKNSNLIFFKLPFIQQTFVTPFYLALLWEPGTWGRRDVITASQFIGRQLKSDSECGGFLLGSIKRLVGRYGHREGLLTWVFCQGCHSRI